MSHDTSKLNHNTPSQWAQILGEIVDKLSGTTMSSTISFDHLTPQEQRELMVRTWAVLIELRRSKL
jgi:hypothetical protein